MGNALTPALAVSPWTKLRRRRELPLAGEILVKEGDRVSGNSIVGVAQLEGELRLVRAADQLGVPAHEIVDLVKVHEGERVQEGAVIAEVRGLWGLFRSVLTAPIDGVVEFISTSTGHIGIRAPARPLQLPAYIAGTVIKVESGRSVVIESEGPFVQGVFGVGGERLGSLCVLSISNDHRLSEADIPEDVKDNVLVGGHSPSIEALRKAATLGAVGLITGSIDDQTLREYVGYDIGVALTGDEPVSMTVIITEGFGNIGLSERIRSVLSRYQGAVVSINGATQVRAGAQRPEVIGYAPDGEQNASPPSSSLEVGARIRLIRVPYFGQTGVVREMPHALEVIETGAAVRVLRATLDDGREVTVPRANVELQ